MAGDSEADVARYGPMDADCEQDLRVRCARMEEGLRFAIKWIEGLPTRPSYDDKATARRVLYGAIHGHVCVSETQGEK